MTQDAAKITPTTDQWRIGSAELRFDDATVFVDGIRFSIDDEGIPNADEADWDFILKALEHARRDRLAEIQVRIPGRSLDPSPWRYVGRFDDELGSVFDVYEPGLPPRLGLQSREYREFVVSESDRARASRSVASGSSDPSTETERLCQDVAIAVELYKSRRSGRGMPERIRRAVNEILEQVEAIRKG